MLISVNVLENDLNSEHYQLALEKLHTGIFIKVLLDGTNFRILRAGACSHKIFPERCGKRNTPLLEVQDWSYLSIMLVQHFYYRFSAYLGTFLGERYKSENSMTLIQFSISTPLIISCIWRSTVISLTQRFQAYFSRSLTS